MNDLIDEVAEALKARQWRMVSAESCTGGLIASHATAIAGSSDWFECAFITYQSRSKVTLLGVLQATIDEHTVVSEPVAREMAIGALERSDADVSVSVTGVAGPTGGDITTPVGTVWLAWATRSPEPVCVQTSRFDFDGNRNDVREAATRAAYEGLLQILSD